MRARAEVRIQATPKAVWDVVTDIDLWADTVTAIEELEILERPKKGLVGLRWRETRTMFGKTATETMWITHAEAPLFYDTRAESHGSIYTTRVALEEHDGGTRLAMEFEGRPVKLSAKLMWGLMGFMFRGATRKALAKDLADIKKAVEAKT